MCADHYISVFFLTCGISVIHRVSINTTPHNNNAYNEYITHTLVTYRIDGKSRALAVQSGTNVVGES